MDIHLEDVIGSNDSVLCLCVPKDGIYVLILNESVCLACSDVVLPLPFSLVSVKIVDITIEFQRGSAPGSARQAYRADQWVGRL